MKSSCLGNIEISSWIPQQEQLTTLLQNAGCPLKSHYASISEAPACNYSAISTLVVTHGGLFNSAFFHLNLRYDPYLNQMVQNRARILFNNYTTNGVGRFSSYGLVCEYLFKFTTQVHSHVAAELRASQELPNAIRISIYLNNINDDRVSQALSQIRNKRSYSSCVIFAASEHSGTLTEIDNMSTRLGCRVLVSKTQVDNAIGNGISEEEFIKARLQSANIHLLSHGEYFIGSSDSSSAFIIANFIAWRKEAQGRKGNPLIWVHSNNHDDIYSNFSTYNCHHYTSQLTDGM